MVSKASHREAKTVLLVNGYKEADALSSALLSHVLQAPILLTDQNDLPTVTRDEIERLGATEIILIGGQQCISDELAARLSRYQISRIGGSDRYETSLLLGEKVLMSKKSNKIVVARGDDFPDALSISALSIKETAPILLTRTDEWSEKSTHFIEERKISSTTIVGGTHAVSETVQKELESMTVVSRLSGKNRYETATAIAKKVYPNAEKWIIASGETAIDAMVAGPLTAYYNAPILLVDHDQIPTSVSKLLVEKGETLKHLIVIGGNTRISDHVETLLKESK